MLRILGVLTVLSVAQGQFSNRFHQAAVNFGKCRVETMINRRIKAGEMGVCVSLPDCPQFAALTTRDPTKDELQLIRLRHCGFYYDTPLVCCPTTTPPSGDNLLPSTISTTTPASGANFLPSTISTTTPASGANFLLSTILTTTPASRDELLPQPGVCGKLVSTRVVGGNITNLDEHRWIALLQYTNASIKEYLCGGSLINHRYVLTAAHCIPGKSLSQNLVLTNVRLGEWDLNEERDCDDAGCAASPIDVAIERVISHESYDPSTSLAHDIALLRLERDVPYSTWIQPICLPTLPDVQTVSFIGENMEVVGWGATETGQFSNLKLKAILRVVDLEQCNQKYRRYSIGLGDGHMCAGGEKAVDACTGDSGGPLVRLGNTQKLRAYFFVAGIVSMGPTPCGQNNFPGVYTRVGAYIDWIKDNIKP